MTLLLWLLPLLHGLLPDVLQSLNLILFTSNPPQKVPGALEVERVDAMTTPIGVTDWARGDARRWVEVGNDGRRRGLEVVGGLLEGLLLEGTSGCDTEVARSGEGPGGWRVGKRMRVRRLRNAERHVRCQVHRASRSIDRHNLP